MSELQYLPSVFQHGFSELRPSKLYSNWTRDVKGSLIPLVTLCDNAGQARVRHLLSYIDKDAPGGRAVIAGAFRVQSATVAELKAKYVAGKTKEFFAGYDESRIRWAAIIAELDKLLPAESTLSPEEHLKKLTKARSENLLDFVLHSQHRQRLR